MLPNIGALQVRLPNHYPKCNFTPRVKGGVLRVPHPLSSPPGFGKRGVGGSASTDRTWAGTHTVAASRVGGDAKKPTLPARPLPFQAAPPRPAPSSSFQQGPGPTPAFHLTCRSPAPESRAPARAQQPLHLPLQPRAPLPPATNTRRKRRVWE